MPRQDIGVEKIIHRKIGQNAPCFQIDDAAGQAPHLPQLVTAENQSPSPLLRW